MSVNENRMEKDKTGVELSREPERIVLREAGALVVIDWHLVIRYEAF
jgi:hypothetical protein